MRAIARNVKCARERYFIRELGGKKKRGGQRNKEEARKKAHNLLLRYVPVHTQEAAEEREHKTSRDKRETEDE